METRVHTGHEPCRHLMPFPRRVLTIGMLAALMGTQSAANAATCYLNTATGSDGNPGTMSAPWKTLAKVQADALRGDTIILQSADLSTYAAPWPTHVSYKARVLRQFEITWTFDTDYSVGQFANNDFWVIGPVTIVGIDPPSTSVNGRIMNGSMVNPVPTWDNLGQGYDSAMPNNRYSPALNVAYDRSVNNPLTLAAKSSLVSAISIVTPDQDWKTTLQRAAILTVVATAPAEGSFRPPYCGSDKTSHFNVSMLNRSLLLNLAPVASTPSITDVADYFAAPWLDHQGNWIGGQQHPKWNMPHYGREMHTKIGIGALMLHLNFTTQQKETLLRRYVQLGIDLYGVATNGGWLNWDGAGGNRSGRKWPILFAGIMLNDTPMKSIGDKSGDYLYAKGYGPIQANWPPDYIHFGEDDQTFYVAQLDVTATHSKLWNPDARDAVRIPYETSDIGLPEWGIRHADNPYASNKWLPTMYRAVAGPPLHGTALAALFMNAKALWNHDVYFDYTDRYMAFTAAGGDYAGWWRSMSAFTSNMWDTYRAQFGPIWPAVGRSDPVLTPIGNQQVTTGRSVTLTLSATGASGTLVYSASGLPAGATLSGNTFTWTPGATQAGSHQVTFTVGDGKAQDSETITITVGKANSPPVLAAFGKNLPVSTLGGWADGPKKVW